MSRRFTHGGRVDTRDRGPFAHWDAHTTTVLDAIAASKAARQACRFTDPDANDNLSRAASDIFRIRNAWGEAATRDAAFDGGEFSGPACADAEETAVERIEEHFFYYEGVTFKTEVARRLSAKAVHNLGF